MDGLTSPGHGVAIAESPYERLASEERREWLQRRIDELPFKQKSTLTLRIVEGMSFKEIGQTLGCSAGSARVNYRHAALKLKDAAERSGVEL
jgi:RNA polymerase sigma-70 factor (ECF subfamily)